MPFPPTFSFRAFHACQASCHGGNGVTGLWDCTLLIREKIVLLFGVPLDAYKEKCCLPFCIERAYRHVHKQSDYVVLMLNFLKAMVRRCVCYMS